MQDSKSKSSLPLHSFATQEFPVHVRRIEYKNPYDFTREHRHDYFEIFFFESGGGSQLIDFTEFPVLQQSSYIVFPKQIHLLKRAQEACGRLVQFREEIVPSAHVNLMLRQLSFGENPAVIFENDPAKITKMGIILDLLSTSSENQTEDSLELTLHYLQALLLELVSTKKKNHAVEFSGDRKLLFDFQRLLEDEFPQNHQVSYFASQLNITEKKLSALTKKHLGSSPLQVIHERILLEAKRMLIFDSISHKEIAFTLGFDSPASFSLFIKNKTGYSPSELNLQLVNIHK
ncbi:MAG: helix-turn-helix transcriptional regulator [Bacteroidota bacterium]